MVVAGGLQSEQMVPDVVPEFAALLNMRYAPERPNGAYSVRIEPHRLMAVVRPTESGYVASVAMLNALGYGTSPEAALDDLAESVRQYLEFIRADKPTLAPSVAHHADFIPLLDAPRGSWFAWVKMDASPVE
jgi:hypothetical protein